MYVNPPPSNIKWNIIPSSICCSSWSMNVCKFKSAKQRTVTKLNETCITESGVDDGLRGGDNEDSQRWRGEGW